MGLKNWLARSVAGVDGYGNTMGRSTGENGLALGRTLYLGHGKSERKTIDCVFENAESMVKQGFDLYCRDSSKLAPAADSSNLSVLTRTAGVAFATTIAMNTANCFSNPENIRSFCRSIGSSNAAYLKEASPDIPMELFTQFLKIEVPPSVTKLVDLDRPGSGDLFGVYLLEISKRSGLASIGFQRRGILGFDDWVTTLAEQTVTAVQGAARQFGF